MKKMSFLAVSCALSCGIIFNYTENTKAEELPQKDIVTKEEAKHKAEGYIKGVSRQSYPNWKEAHVDEGQTLYNLDGNVVGYVFQVEKENQDKGYIIASSKKQKSSIIESTREGSNPYKNIEEGKGIYTGPLQHYKKLNNNIENISTKETVNIQDAKLKQVEKKNLRISKENGNALMLEQDPLEFKQNLIPNVPDNQWHYGCTPSAFSNIVGYWDQNGYNNLVNDNETTNQVIEKLGKEMKTIPGVFHPGGVVEGGSTAFTDMVPGFKKYWNNRGYNPEISFDETTTYDEYVKEIDAGRPIAVSTLNDAFYSTHTITGVGYEQVYIPEINEDYKNIIIHDTWPITPVDTYFDYNGGQKYIHSFVTVKPFIHKEKKAQVHYNWGSGGPFANHTDDFMAKFDQSQHLNDGDYFVQTVADDNVKVNFDDKTLIDGWYNNSTGQIKRALITKVSKGNHAIQTDFYENWGDAAIFSDIVPFDHWLAYYYPNKNLEGLTPVDAKIIAPQGAEKALVENSGEGSPTPKIPADNFSARYTTVKRLPAGEYIIRGKADDGMRVYIDGKLVIDEWDTGKWDKEHARKITIQDNTAGSAFGSTNEKDTHLVEVQYIEEIISSDVKFSIEPYKNVVQHDTWIAEYYNNKELKGDAVIVGGKNSRDKIDQINFDWKNGSPGAGVQADNFSARFTKVDHFEKGNYSFEAKADDGVRVYVDDKKIIDSWIPSAGGVRSVKVPMEAGKHKITVEYLELTGGAGIQATYKKQ